MGLDWLVRLQDAIATEWIKIHGPAKVFIGEVVEAVRDITQWDKIIISRGTCLRISWINVFSQEWNGLWFGKRIMFESLEWEFNPQRFRLAPSEN